MRKIHKIAILFGISLIIVVITIGSIIIIGKTKDQAENHRPKEKYHIPQYSGHCKEYAVSGFFSEMRLHASSFLDNTGAP